MEQAGPDTTPGPAPRRTLPGRSQLRSGFVLTAGGILAVGLTLALQAVASELLLVVVAAFVAVGLEPAVSWLAARGMRRTYAVALILMGALGAVAGFLAAALPPLGAEAQALVVHAPQYVASLTDPSTTLGRVVTDLHLQDKASQLASASINLSAFGGILGAGEVVVSYTFQTIIVIVLVIYFLADFPGIKHAAYRLAPYQRRPRVALLGDEIISRTGGYVLGNLFTSLVATVAQYVVLRALGVPFALALSVFVGILDLVPLVGSTIAGVGVSVVTLATAGVTAAVVNVVFTVVYRLFEDYVLSPRVLARTVEVRPAVTVIAVLLGGGLLGIEGALIAVPVAAAIQLLVTEVVYPRTDGPDGPPVLPATER